MPLLCAFWRLPAPILKALREKRIDAKTAEAFTLTADAKLQVELFARLGKRGDLNRASVRGQLTGKALSADAAHARFVGETAYAAAGAPWRYFSERATRRD